MTNKLTTLGYATLANAVYSDGQSEVGGYTRHLLRRHDACGFHASLYVRVAAGQAAFVLSFAGSETSEGGVDWQADVGFGGGKVSGGMLKAGVVLGAMRYMGGAGMVAGMAGDALTKAAIRWPALLLDQRRHAVKFAQDARATAAGRPLTVTGHSLGGGLALIAAAHTGLAAVTFSAPTVSAVTGVTAAFEKNKPTVVNFRIKNDPVNVSELTGQRIGRVITMMSPRSVAAAHQMGNTIAELLPQGQFCATGAQDPFTITATAVVT